MAIKNVYITENFQKSSQMSIQYKQTVIIVLKNRSSTDYYNNQDKSFAHLWENHSLDDSVCDITAVPCRSVATLFLKIMNDKKGTKTDRTDLRNFTLV